MIAPGGGAIREPGGTDMSDIDAFVGLDVHKEQIAVAIAGDGRDGEVRLWGTVPNKPGAVERLIKKLRERRGRSSAPTRRDRPATACSGRLPRSGTTAPWSRPR